MNERFYLPEEKTSFTAEEAEQANRSAQNQMRFVFVIGVAACLFFGSICYDGTSVTNFLVYIVAAGLFLYGLWRFNKRVEENERIKNSQKQVLPAEELFLSEKDIVLEIKKLTPEKIVIPWENLLSFGGGLMEYDDSNGREKISAPRAISANEAVFTEFIEKYTQLKKVVKKHYLRGEEYDVIYYEK
jgi:hypothetical protein